MFKQPAWTTRQKALYWGLRIGWSSKTENNLQSSWNCLRFLTSTLLLHAWEIKFLFEALAFFCFVLLLIAKPNLNGYFPISIVYVFSMHLWYQNGTVFNVTSHLQMGYGFISYFRPTPQIPLTSYRMNSIHSITSERSSPRQGKK